jgi:hypothetical protein
MTYSSTNPTSGGGFMDRQMRLGRWSARPGGDTATAQRQPNSWRQSYAQRASGYQQPPAAPKPAAPKPPQQPAGQASAQSAQGPAQPAFPTDPNQALAQAGQQFQSRFNRAMTPQEQQALIGYAGYTGGPVTQEQWGKVTQAIGQYSGDLSKPGIGAPAPAAPPASPGQGPLPYGWSAATSAVATPPGYQPGAPPPGMRPGADALLDQILANPRTLDETAVNQMKMASKETALQQFNDLQGAAQADRAARGFSNQGGVAQGQGRELRQGLVNSLINSNRDIDLAAVEQNRQDELNALGAAQAAQGMDLQAWGMGEQTLQNAAQLGLAGAEFDYGQRRDDRNMALQEYLGRQGVGLDDKRITQQGDQFKQSLALDLARFLEGQRQFNTSFGEDQRQFNNSLGFNYTNLGVQGQQALMDYINRLYS